MQEENREGISGALKTLAAVVIVFLLLAALYVGYQALSLIPFRKQVPLVEWKRISMYSLSFVM